MANKKQSVMQEAQTQLDEQEWIKDVLEDEGFNLIDTEAVQEEFANEYLKSERSFSGEETIAEFSFNGNTVTFTQSIGDILPDIPSEVLEDFIPEPDDEQPTGENEVSVAALNEPVEEPDSLSKEKENEEEVPEEEPEQKKKEREAARPDLLLPEDKPVFTNDMTADEIVDVACMAVLASGEKTTVFEFGDNEIEIIPEENDNAALKLKRALDPNKFADQMKGVNVYINGIQVDKDTFKNFIDQDKEGFVKAVSEAFPDIAKKINRMNQRIDRNVEKEMSRGTDADEAIAQAISKEDVKLEKDVAKTSQRVEKHMEKAGVPVFRGGEIKGAVLSEGASDLDKQIHEAAIRSARDEISRTEEAVYTKMPANKSITVLIHNPVTREAEHVVEFAKFGGKTVTRVDNSVDYRDSNGVTKLQKLAEQYPGQLETNTKAQIEYLVGKESRSKGYNKTHSGEVR